MNTTTSALGRPPLDAVLDSDDSGLALSWGAVLAGAAAAAAFSLILFVLGTGLGLTALSPWSDRGGSAAKFGFAAIVWVMVTQVVASGLGGYLAGRLRARYRRAHADETYFRDTAHGFLAWAIATLFAAGVLASALAGLTSTVTKVAAPVAAAGVAAAASGPAAAQGGAGPMDAGPSAYLMDSLFRKDMSTGTAGAAAAPLPPETRAEVRRIYVQGLTGQTLPEQDVKYVGGLISTATGLPAADAERRATQVFTQAQAQAKEMEASAKEAADKARKALVTATLWLFVSLLLGAFAASYFAIHGGRQRDL
jgi:hypothetical protein